MDSFIYEIRPWVYLLMGFAALFFSGESRIMYGSSLLLLLATSIILNARYQHRRLKY